MTTDLHALQTPPRSPGRPFLGSAWLRGALGQRRAFWLSLSGFVLILLACFASPLFASDAESLIAAPFEPPSAAYLFGTDSLGRDVFSRTLAAGRIDITVALVVVAVSAIVGSVVGVAVAMASRAADTVVMRVVDALIAFPYFVVVLLLVVLIGPNLELGFLPRGLPAMLLAFLVVGWTYYARLARGQAMSLRSRDYVVAARLLGYSRTRTLFVHVLPGVSRVVLAYAVSDAILTMGALASFAFLGVGVQPPTPEWGAMMYEGRAYLGSAWWVAVFPGVLLTLTGLVLSTFADSIRGDDER
jgi:peptide/nickel transport system permease protein